MAVGHKIGWSVGEHQGECDFDLGIRALTRSTAIRVQANLMRMRESVSLDGKIKDCSMSTGFQQSQANMQKNPTKEKHGPQRNGKSNGFTCARLNE